MSIFHQICLVQKASEKKWMRRIDFVLPFLSRRPWITFPCRCSRNNRWIHDRTLRSSMVAQHRSTFSYTIISIIDGPVALVFAIHIPGQGNAPWCNEATNGPQRWIERIQHRIRISWPIIVCWVIWRHCRILWSAAIIKRDLRRHLRPCRLVRSRIRRRPYRVIYYVDDDRRAVCQQYRLIASCRSIHRVSMPVSPTICSISRQQNIPLDQYARILSAIVRIARKVSIRNRRTKADRCTRNCSKRIRHKMLNRSTSRIWLDGNRALSSVIIFSRSVHSTIRTSFAKLRISPIWFDVECFIQRSPNNSKATTIRWVSNVNMCRKCREKSSFGKTTASKSL